MASFRSEEMGLYQFFFQSEALYETLSHLGEVGLIQFIDMNHKVNLYKRKYTGEVRRCEKVERILKMLRSECSKEGNIFATNDEALSGDSKQYMDKKPFTYRELTELEKQNVQSGGDIRNEDRSNSPMDASNLQSNIPLMADLIIGTTDTLYPSLSTKPIFRQSRPLHIEFVNIYYIDIFP
ncbi:unnamed protein product [Gordionus sp. m RMFG-2023]